MKKEIEVVTGDGSNLNISPVEDHMNSLRRKSVERKQVIVPKEIKETKKTEKKDKKKF